MIQARLIPWTRIAVLTAAALALAALGGCASHRMTPQELIKQERPVVMKGDSEFLDGSLLVTVTLSRGFQRAQMTGMRGFKQSDAEQIVEQIMNLDPEDKAYNDDVIRLLNLEVKGSRLPPVTATLRLTNRSSREIEVQVSDFNSDLGNFSVQPAKVKLAANESIAVEPMTSTLGVGGTVIPVKVGLKADGKSDIHTVDVKSVVAQTFNEGKK